MFSQELTGKGVVVAIGNFRYSGGFRFSETVCKEYRGDYPAGYDLSPGDILLVMTCQTAGGEILGIPAKVPSDGRLYLHNQRIGKVVLTSDDVREDFLYWLFLSPDFNRSLVSTASGTKILHTSPSRICDYRFLLPAPEIQREAARTLDALQDRIDLLRQTNATFESIAQALFKSWFIDFDPVRAKAEGREPAGMDATTAALFPAEFEESSLGLIPKGWRVLPFLDACDLAGGAQPPASTFVDEPREGYIRLLQIRDFSSDAHLTFVPDSKKLKRAGEDDVFIGRYGSASGDKTKDSLGRVCRGLTGAYNVALMKLVPKEVGREFAAQMVDAPSFYSYLQGVSSKAVQSGFSKSELGNLAVVVPPKPLSNVYEATGLAVWRRIKANREHSRSLEALRDSLLPRLISGTLRLPEAQAQLEEAIA
ncbi:restriction endonuclease subunit S [Variovorax ureilyticus]|uniref:restriction endonuclease subunit S n=1 Tax=Variovorax ureilyticus TaxID=1836198 RepID=UPI003D669DAA